MPITEDSQELRNALMAPIPTAPNFGAPGQATRLFYSAENPGYPNRAPANGLVMASDATMAWGAPYDLSGSNAEAPARGESASKEVERASGLI